MSTAATKHRRRATSEHVFNRVRERAESIKSDDARKIEVMDIGDELRQGDVYVTRIEGVPRGADAVEHPSSQMAPGATQGSRHTLRSLDGVTVYRMPSAGPLDGPVIDLRGPVWLDHPEHGNRRLPAGVYAITYQRAFGDELRAVQD